MNPLIAGLLKREAYPHPVAEFEVLETHISWVILTGDYAYKIKKPVRFDFVDFSTAELRRRYCDEELRLNRRLTSDIYLGVSGIYGSEESPSFIESGSPFEFAVQMRQFDQRSLLPEVLARGELRTEGISALANRVSRFHQTAETAPADTDYGTPSTVQSQTMDCLTAIPDLPCSTGGDSLKSWVAEEFQKRLTWFQQRRSEGWVRECHGDMHLGNMVLRHGEIEVFDCIEFNPWLRWIDVISEVAFLVMDLHERERLDLAFQFLNRWLEHFGDYSALKGLRWYIVYRALVRAKVSVLRLHQAELPKTERSQLESNVEKYLSLAEYWTRQTIPCVVVTHGLSGSGKSCVAEWLSRRFGFILVRSDVERKRMFSMWGAASGLPNDSPRYTPEVTSTLYRNVLPQCVSQALDCGLSIVVDAACLHRWQRQVFQDLALQSKVSFLVINVTAEKDTLRQRLEKRQADSNEPSDATPQVLEHQIATFEPLDDRELESAITVNTERQDWRMSLEQSIRRRLKRD